MKICVAGGAGYIGSHVVLALLEKGHEVTVFDNLSTGRRENLFPDCLFVPGDLLNKEDLRKCFSKPFDGVVHLAAKKAAGISMEEPEFYAENNINGTVNLINAAVTAGTENIIFSSSAAVYGEPQYLPVDEPHPLNPENFYGFTKLEIERLLFWFEKLRGLRFASLRYFNAAGYDSHGRIKGLENNPANLLPVVMEVAAGVRLKLSLFGNDYPTKDGSGIRDYVHVTDLADAHVKALDFLFKEKESLTVNLGSDNGISVLDMVETAKKVTGRDIPIEITKRRPGDPAKLVASSSLAKVKLGWEASRSDAETLIETTWKVYRETFFSDR